MFLIAAVCLAGCVGGDGLDRGSAARDNAVVVDNRERVREWPLSPEPVLRIGVSVGSPEYQFDNVRFAARLQDGRIVVVDGSSREIRWYDASGRHRASVGRRGGGPSEFAEISSGVVTAGDTLVVHDARNQRVTWISPAELIVREEPLAGMGGNDVRLLNVLEDGRVVLSQPRSVRAFGSSDFAYTRDSLAVLLYSPSKVDTFVEMQGNEAATWTSYVDGRPRGTLPMELPFGFQVLPGATRKHIVIGVTERRQLEILDSAAKLLRVARRSDVAPIRVSSKDRDRFVEYMTERAKSRGAPDLALVIRGARDRLALLPEGRDLPAFDRLIVDGDDRIWVRDYRPPWVTADSLQMWTIYSEGGEVLARIGTPGSLEIMHAGRNHITGVQRDESNVEYVTVHQFEAAG